MQAYTKTVGVRLLDVPQHLDREYTYYVPQTLWLSLAVGDFVLVPFGGANKKHSALVTSVSETEDYSKLKPILAQINTSLSLDEEMMALIRFLCDRTLCTMGDAVRRLIPAAAFAKSDEYFSVNKEALTSDKKLNTKATLILDFITAHEPVREERIEKEFGPEVRPILRRLVSEGLLSADTVIKESVGASEDIVFPVSNPDTSVLLKPRTPETHRRLWNRICNESSIAAQNLIDEGYKPAQIKALEKKGLLTVAKKEVLRTQDKLLRSLVR